MAQDERIVSAIDNRFNLKDKDKYEFNPDIDSEGACAGTCEAFS